MIISRITGGLGNQMFQYAAGRALALERGSSWRLDISDFTNYNHQQGFELERIFHCLVAFASNGDVRGMLGWQHSSLSRKILSRRSMRVLRHKQFIIEPHFHYWPEINNAPRDCYLSGYWQSEKYFKMYARVIRADFSFQLPLTNRNAEIAEKIAQVNAVSLHVRRGDYASNPKLLAKHGVCPLTYYEAAIQYITAHIAAPHFFVFSDDMDWVRANLQIKQPCYYIFHNRGVESYNDMRLMSLCRHHIIANSSFSWWGAWLNPSPAKIVLAPQRWFNDYPVNLEDLLPAGWIPL